MREFMQLSVLTSSTMKQEQKHPSEDLSQNENLSTQVDVQSLQTAWKQKILNRPCSNLENQPDASLEIQRNQEGPTVILNRTLADGVSDLIRFLKNFFESNADRTHAQQVIHPAFPTATQLPPRQPGESRLAHFFEHLQMAVERVVAPTDPDDIALANQDIPSLIKLAQPGFPVNLLMLGPVSKGQTQRVADNVKEQAKFLTVVVSVLMFMLIGLCKIAKLDFTYTGLLGGTIPFGMLFTAVVKYKECYGLNFGNMVNLSMIFALHFVMWTRQVPVDGAEDRSLYLSTCLCTMILNNAVRMETTLNKFFDVAFKCSYLAFVVKSDCSVFEIAILIFLYLVLVILKSGALSTQLYQFAYLQRYRDTIRSNEKLRELTYQSLRNSISAIQLNAEQANMEKKTENRIIRKTNNLQSVPSVSQCLTSNIKSIAQLANFYDQAARQQFLELDSMCIIEDAGTRQLALMTRDILNCNGVYLVNTIGFVKQSLIAFHGLTTHKQAIVSVFLIEPQHEVPLKILIHRDNVAALLSSILQLSLSTTMKKGVSIYISWSPRNQAKTELTLERHIQSIDPVYVLMPRKNNEAEKDAKDKPNSISNSQKNLSTRAAFGFSGEAQTQPTPPTGSSGPSNPSNPSNPSAQENKKTHEFLKMLHSSQLQPFSFSSTSEQLLGSQIKGSSINSNGGYENSSQSFSRNDNQFQQNNGTSLQYSRLQGRLGRKRVNSAHLSRVGELATNKNSLEGLLSRFTDSEASMSQGQHPGRPTAGLEESKFSSNITQLSAILDVNPDQQDAWFYPKSPTFDDNISYNFINKPRQKWYADQNGDLSRVEEHSKEEARSLNSRDNGSIESVMGSYGSNWFVKSNQSERNPSLSSSRDSLNNARLIEGQSRKASLQGLSNHSSFFGIIKGGDNKANEDLEEEKQQKLDKLFGRQSVRQIINDQKRSLSEACIDELDLLEIAQEDALAREKTPFCEDRDDSNAELTREMSYSSDIHSAFQNGKRRPMMRLLEQLMEYRLNAPSHENNAESKAQMQEDKQMQQNFRKEEERWIKDELRIKKLKATMGSAGETIENFSASSEDQNSFSSSLRRRYRNQGLEKLASSMRDQNSEAKERLSQQNQQKVRRSAGNNEEQKQNIKNSSDESNNQPKSLSVIQEVSSALTPADNSNSIGSNVAQSSEFAGSGANHDGSQEKEKEGTIGNNKAILINAKADKSRAEDRIQNSNSHQSQGSGNQEIIMDVSKLIVRVNPKKFSRSNEPVSEQIEVYDLRMRSKSIVDEKYPPFTYQNEKREEEESDETKKPARKDVKLGKVVQDERQKISSDELPKVNQKPKKKKGSFSSYTFGVIKQEQEERKNAKKGPAQQVSQQQSKLDSSSRKGKKLVYNVAKRSKSVETPSVKDAIENKRRINIKKKVKQDKDLRSRSVQDELDAQSLFKNKLRQQTAPVAQEEKEESKITPISTESSQFKPQLQNLRRRNDGSNSDESSSFNMQSFKDMVLTQLKGKEPNQQIQTMIMHMMMIQQQMINSEDGSGSGNKAPSMTPSMPSSINKDSNNAIQSEQFTTQHGLSSSNDEEKKKESSSTANHAGSVSTNENPLANLDSSPQYPSTEQPTTENQPGTSSSNQEEQKQHNSPPSSTNQQQSNSSNGIIQHSSELPMGSLTQTSNEESSREKIDSYYAQLKSLVTAQETSTEATELLSIIQSWDNKIYMPNPPMNDLFDGILKFQLFDLKTCRLQHMTAERNSSKQISQRSNCGENNCNRNRTLKLQSGTFERQSWIDVLKSLRLESPPNEIEAVKRMAELLGAEVLVLPKTDTVGNQFQVSVPVMSVPQHQNKDKQ